MCWRAKADLGVGKSLPWRVLRLSVRYNQDDLLNFTLSSRYVHFWLQKTETLNGERKLKCRSRLRIIQEDLSRQSKSMNTERQKFVVNTWFIHFLIYSTGLPVLAVNFQELLRVSTILHCFKNNQKKRSIGVNADDTTLSTKGPYKNQDGSCLSAKPKASKNWRLTWKYYRYLSR